MSLTIGEVARRLGVSEKTVINWEKAGRITPTRTAGGWRIYAEAEVLRLKEFVDARYHANRLRGGTRP